MLLRIGAGVNAMEVSQRLMLQVGRADNRPVTMLAQVHCALAGIAYWREIVKMIEKEYKGRLWELVQIGVGCGPQPSLSVPEAMALLSTAHPELGGEPLKKIRDKIGFHWDLKPFQAYLDDPDTRDVVFLESDGGHNAERIFRASSDATAHFFSAIPGSGGSWTDLLPLLAKAQGLGGQVVEAALFGLIIEAGEDPRTYWHPSVNGRGDR